MIIDFGLQYLVPYYLKSLKLVMFYDFKTNIYLKNTMPSSLKFPWKQIKHMTELP